MVAEDYREQAVSTKYENELPNKILCIAESTEIKAQDKNIRTLIQEIELINKDNQQSGCTIRHGW
jgi:hypothetical protein